MHPTVTNSELILPQVEAFIERWRDSGGGERANFQPFLEQLCDLLEVPRPKGAGIDVAKNDYVYERDVEFKDGTVGRIDLYKAGCFVMEGKQGVEKHTPDDIEKALGKKKLKKGIGERGSQVWALAMEQAKNQADRYARSVPPDERPPFLVVVDVGYAFDVYSEFSRTGGVYQPFPDPQSHRVLLDDLRRPEIRDLLRRLWTDPLSLDPSARSAKVTREIAGHLALLAQSLEKSHDPETVAAFLMRCVFTMFAEDVSLVPKYTFTGLLEDLKAAANFKPMAESLWRTMNEGGFYDRAQRILRRFNGGLFAEPEALDLTEPQVALLVRAAKADWRDVEPAIFGTLLERALDPRERHKLGAHFTPRAFVERVVVPSVIAPLREVWTSVKAAAAQSLEDERPKEAAQVVADFHRRLCETFVLDPACGSGNFLYVALEHMQRLEGEVLNFAAGLGKHQQGLGIEGLTVDPHQFLGIEVNPRAAAIAEVVLWIGHLQWHFRTRGTAPARDPVLKQFRNIECRDAVLDWDERTPRLGDDGAPLTVWDMVTYKADPVTGQEVPDEKARIPVHDYAGVRPAPWPEADFIVSNPPFVGNKHMRRVLGDGYVEALRRAWPEVPQTADYVMYWWERAAQLTRDGAVQRFGLITTNSITQVFNRKILSRHLDAPKDPLRLTWAIADHPWVDEAGSANVRIAMTVAERAGGDVPATLARAVEGRSLDAVWLMSSSVPKIHADLTSGADVASAVPLEANKGLSFQGITLVGTGFRLSRGELGALNVDPAALPAVVRPYLNARDLNQAGEPRFVIDLFGMTVEEARGAYPALYQHVLTQVKPERDQNKRRTYRLKWWEFGEPRPAMRVALRGLPRYIVTAKTSRHRIFSFLPSEFLVDGKIYVIVTDSAAVLGILSSRAHVVWATAAGGRQGVGDDPVYNNEACFEKFPFPGLTDQSAGRIEILAEALDAHRKGIQAADSKAHLTAQYNAMGRLREARSSGPPLTAQERGEQDAMLTAVLDSLHEDIDRAVFEAYGWSMDLSDDEILQHLSDLNRRRHEEEQAGLVRWLRSDRQRLGAQTAIMDSAKVAAPTAKQDARRPWPKELSLQMLELQRILATRAKPTTAAALAKDFTRARQDRVQELLETLASLGIAREVEPGRYAA